LAKAADFEKMTGSIDTIICVNVLEHVDDDAGAMRNMHAALPPDGRLVLLVPHLQSLFGTLDEALEHRRRYAKDGLRALAQAAGFSVETIFEFNRASAPGWLLNGRLLRKRDFGRFQLKIFDSLVWLFRLIDGWLPWPGQSVVLVARKPR
jgi:SAM-dependent methyltransferase